MSEIKKIQWNEVKRLMRCHRKKKYQYNSKIEYQERNQLGKKRKQASVNGGMTLCDPYIHTWSSQKKREKREKEKNIYIVKKNNDKSII